MKKWTQEFNVENKGFRIETVEHVVNGEYVTRIRITKRTPDDTPTTIDFRFVEAHALRKYLDDLLDAMMFGEDDESTQDTQ